MQETDLSGLTLQFLEDRFDGLGRLFDQIPLGSRWQRHAKAILEIFDPVHGHSQVIVQDSQLAANAWIVFALAGLWRRWGCEDLQTTTASELLHVIDCRRENRLGDNMKDYGRVFEQIHFALLAAWANVSRLEMGVRHVDSRGSGIVFSPVSPVAGAFLFFLGG